MCKNMLYFEAGFTETETALAIDNPDCFLAVTIEGYPDDASSDSARIVTIFLTKHGSFVTAWHDNEYKSDNTVKALINTVKIDMLEKYHQSKYGGQGI